jgi:beta-lactamase regulating signal transducer with metallopeptidase domain
MKLAALAGRAEVHALGWALIHFLWQGALIAAALRIALALLPRARSSARHAACCAALTSMLFAPLATFARLLASYPTGSLQSGQLVAPTDGQPETYLFLLIIAVWALGSTIMTARLTLGVTHLRGLVRRAGEVDDAWRQRLTALVRRVGLWQRVRLLESSEIDAPLMMGWIRPVIFMPLGALASLPAPYVEALLLHELGHARRLDYLANLVQACVEAVLFYHPAVHWVSACLRREREYCCDDLAVSVTGDPLGYARALATMESLRGAMTSPALAANGAPLLARIERLVRGEGPRMRQRPRAALAAGLLASAMYLSLAGIWACGTPDGDVTSRERTTESAFVDSEAALVIPWLPPGLERWKPALTEAAQRHQLNPALLAIVTLVESLGNPAAHSPSGAIGLMQIMPSTAAQIAAERGLVDYSESQLWDPAYNLDLGAWYLAEQLAAFRAEGDRSVALAAVAYNAGPQRARAYLERAAPLFEETERYRDLVVGMWRERERDQSPTFTAWREGRRAGRAASGRPPLQPR